MLFIGCLILLVAGLIESWLSIIARVPETDWVDEKFCLSSKAN